MLVQSLEFQLNSQFILTSSGTFTIPLKPADEDGHLKQFTQ